MFQSLRSNFPDRHYWPVSVNLKLKDGAYGMDKNNIEPELSKGSHVPVTGDEELNVLTELV